MNQLALFAGKREGPPKRPPAPTIAFSPKRFDKEDTTIARKRKATASPVRHKVKTVRAASGRHRYLVLYGKTPVFLGRDEHAKVGDAKAAGKKKARDLAEAGPPPVTHVAARRLLPRVHPQGKDGQGRHDGQRRHAGFAVSRVLGRETSGAAATMGGGVAMGTRRMEAWIATAPLYQLDYTDEILMSRICHRWNDHQIRPLDIRFSRLLQDMPYRGQARPERMLRRSLMRLSELGILHVDGNGARYLQDRWLHISITCTDFRKHFDGCPDTVEEEAVQPQLLQSRALVDQTAPMIHRGSNSRAGGSNRAPMIHRGSNSRAQRASHSRAKISKETQQKKDDHKGRPAGLHGHAFAQSGHVSEETSTPAPRPALVQTETLAEPETAAAVYNTLEMPAQEKRSGCDPDLRAELNRLHDFIAHPLNQFNLAAIETAKARIKEITQPRRKGKPDDHNDRQRSSIPRVPAGEAHVRALQGAEAAGAVP